MDADNYDARVAFLKFGTIPATLHGWARQNWKRSVQAKYRLAFEEHSTYHKAILKIRHRIQGPLAKSEVKRAIVKRENVLSLIHETHCSFGHPGRDQMMRLIGKNWFWNGMKKDIETYLARCEKCLISKPFHLRPPLHPILASGARERAMYDLMEMPIDPVTQERYILVVIDIFTKHVWTKGLTTKTKGPIKRFLEDTFSSRPFHIYQSDNWGEFKNHELGEMI